MKVEIVNADITTLQVDAIVNAANNALAGGGGVDGAIHRAAGPQLREYCLGLKGCKTGYAKISPGFKLPSKFVIHAVGPVWSNGTGGEEKLLAMCYEHCLQLAIQNGIKTIAFPCISTGAYRFPFEKAGGIALATIDAFLQQHLSIEKVYLVVFGDRDFNQYLKLFKKYNQ